MEKRRFFTDTEDKREREWFEKIWSRQGFEVVGFLEEKFETGESMTRVVLKGKWTPFGTGRMIGNRIVIARYSQYDSWNMKTDELLEDVEDR